MNARLVSCAFLLMIGVMTNADARLGETVDQLTVRYGQGTNAGAATADYPVSVLTFHKQNWSITVCLINGISVGEKYQKSGGVDDESIKSLLAINADGHEWKLTQSSPSLMATLWPTPGTVAKQWTRDDGAVATLPAGMRIFLDVESRQLLDAKAALAAAQKKAHEASTQGF